MDNTDGLPASPSLNLQSFTQALAEFKQEPPSPIAFTCTPAFYAAIQAKMRAGTHSRYPGFPLASQVVADVFMLNVYSVPNQAEDCVAFYDRKTLRDYLRTMEAARASETAQQ
jgi:hypothetical protein